MRPSLRRSLASSVIALIGALAGGLSAADRPLLIHTFEKHVLSDQFYDESANFADFNRDGKMDVVSGPFWYEGPDFTVKHQIYPAQAFDPHAYSHNFFTFTYDLDGDGYPDVLTIGMPSEEAAWYRNPGKDVNAPWQRFKVFDTVDNESPTFVDITGDGKPELVCTYQGRIGYVAVNWEDPTKPWTFHPISEKGTWHKYTHGLGVGDVNGDGRKDIMMVEGWWEQPASLAGDPVWVKHEAKFGGTGGAQMWAVDMNGDKRPDVVTSLVAHGYGLAWFEQNADATFTQHLIIGDKPEQNPYGVSFSQMHAVVVADMDGDGLPDIVTGKRWWAHGPKNDPGADQPAVLYWFQQVRDQNGVSFVPHLIDSDSGVGTHLVVGDLDGDGLPDIVVGNKKGTFVFLHRTKAVTKEEYDQAQPKPVK